MRVPMAHTPELPVESTPWAPQGPLGGHRAHSPLVARGFSAQLSSQTSVSKTFALQSTQATKSQIFARHQRCTPNAWVAACQTHALAEAGRALRNSRLLSCAPPVRSSSRHRAASLPSYHRHAPLPKRLRRTSYNEQHGGNKSDRNPIAWAQPNHALTRPPAGGHALRRGGAQVLCNARPQS